MLDRYLPSLHRFLTNIGTFPKPPETASLNNYLRGLRAQIENEIKSKTYIPLTGKEIPPSALADEADEDPFVQPIHRVIRHIVGLAQGGDSASAQIAAVSRKSRVVRNIFKTLLGADDPLILLGDPGTGKTMTLQQTALAFADSEIDRVFPIVTLYLRLGEFYVSGKIGPESVLDFVKASVAPAVGPYIDELDVAGGRLIILFDGMDEMSRERYGEYTEALSIFAGSRRGRTRTLFSCRITDFSPRFIHQRLVLLPFNREQMTQYLRNYIPTFPIKIDGESWTLRRLAGRLAQGDLPLEPNNPFVLWLLCFHLQKKGTWPSSRVEILHFYNEQNYKRKTGNPPEGEPPLPDMERAFLGIGRVAYDITRQNRGAAMPIRVLTEDGSEGGGALHDIIRVGKRCGVFVESGEGHEQQIRFEHHRFQEFFTALYIHRVKLKVSWLDKLDAPRWQETMLNLIIMGGADDAVRILTDSIEEIISPLSAAVTAKDEAARTPAAKPTDGKAKTAPARPSLPEKKETAVADRIELASRIVRHAGQRPFVKEKLLPTFRHAVSLLAEHGNPITQVKMMRACQNVPDVNLVEVLGKASESPVNWVRNQALIIISSGERNARKVGSHFATELGYDLANGTLLTRLPAYAKAAWAAKRARNWWCLAMGTCGYLLSVLLLLATAALLYYLAALIPSELFPLPLERPAYIVTYAGIVCGAALLGLKFNPRNSGAAVLGSAYASLALLPVIRIAWQGSIFNFITLTPLVGAVGFYGTSLVGAAIHFIGLTFYVTCTAGIRKTDRRAGNFYRVGWQNGWFKRGVSDLAEILPFALFPIGLFLIYFAWSYLQQAGQWLNETFNLPLYDSVTAIILFCIIAAIVGGAIAAVKKRADLLPKVFFGVIGCTILLLVFIIMFVAGTEILRWLVEWAGEATASYKVYLGRGVAAVILLIISGVVVYGLWRVARTLTAFMRRHGPAARPDSVSPHVWRARIAAAPAEQQRVLLDKTTHQTIGLNAEDFLALLKEVQVFIKEEPALSGYWDKRDQLEQVLKQERQ